MVNFNLSKEWERICKSVKPNKQLEFLVALLDLREGHPKNYVSLYLIFLIGFYVLTFYIYRLGQIFLFMWFLGLLLHSVVYAMAMRKFANRWLK